MINEITEGIAEKIKGGFRESCSIFSEQIRQGFHEPCFFIKIKDYREKKMVGSRYLDEYAFEIRYYPKKKPVTGSLVAVNRDLQDTAEGLYDCLEYITAEESLLRGSGMSHEIRDGILYFQVKYSLFILKLGDEEATQTEKMEALEMKQERKER